MFDMRAPAFGTPRRELYASALDMISFADEIGVPRINLMEHHCSDDGYLPVPFVLGGGVAARTKRCRITIGAVVLPLHDPVKIAEQIAVLDIMSGGRLEVILAAGYVPSEFAAFGVSLKERARRMDQGIDTILRALHGEKFAAPDGRPVHVCPLPLQSPEDILLVGGGVEASARRAARFGLGFVPTDPALVDLYQAECRRLGRAPGKVAAPVPPMNAHLSEEPDTTWKKLRPHVAHVVQAYASWADESPGSRSPFRGLHDVDSLRSMGLFVVWSPEEFVEHAVNLNPLGTISMAPLLGGLDPEEGWQSLQLLAKAIPKWREVSQAKQKLSVVQGRGA
jgi:alkanesulfonate monooxygenase SsuD/methylene tetrahydromethanopterin reductase-like flavin-dependent oxidoreductase (luciferase family)